MRIIIGYAGRCDNDISKNNSQIMTRANEQTTISRVGTRQPIMYLRGIPA